MDSLSIILSLVLLYGGIRLLYSFATLESQKLLMFALALIFYFLSSLVWVVSFFHVDQSTLFLITAISSWLQVTGVSFALCGLAIENWEDRPPVARFPYALAFAPVLLILSYGFVFQTVFLKELILALYEAGALFIGLMLFILFTVKNANYLYTVIGNALLLLSFAVYWFPGDLVADQPWIWQLIAIIAIPIIVQGYLSATRKVLQERESDF